MNLDSVHDDDSIDRRPFVVIGFILVFFFGLKPALDARYERMLVDIAEGRINMKIGLPIEPAAIGSSPEKEQMGDLERVAMATVMLLLIVCLVVYGFIMLKRFIGRSIRSAWRYCWRRWWQLDNQREVVYITGGESCLVVPATLSE